ncbi:MAG: phosphoglucomutase [Treponemataceae bacterium]|nr:MAG: phosphoglucomutase [Treponemataceae bacterium]
MAQTNIQEKIDAMVLSASGWRTIFAFQEDRGKIIHDENDKTPNICKEHQVIAALAAESFLEFLQNQNLLKVQTVIALGMDTRPTGRAIADEIIKTLSAANTLGESKTKIIVEFIGIAAAPEIMAYSRSKDAFIYVSASHNPIGHNGIKFGLNTGGVINKEESDELIGIFKKKCSASPLALYERIQKAVASDEQKQAIQAVYRESAKIKKAAVDAYFDFSKEVAADTSDKKTQEEFFSEMREMLKAHPLAVLCDMNGSARTLSIDRAYFESIGLQFFEIHSLPGKIAHGIIPEGNNLRYAASALEMVRRENDASFFEPYSDACLGYMPDCDGDRGNIVYFDEQVQRACALEAQDVFALSVLAELAFLEYAASTGKSKNDRKTEQKNAVIVNCPTSMRINEIASLFGAEVFRAEVGEANVVNLAREKRAEGYTVRILGEGSNGGNITHPAAVRDPVNSITSILKLLVMRARGGKPGLFESWCNKCGVAYKNNFTLADVIETLPQYTTTETTEDCAVLDIKTADHQKLKNNFQKHFESWYAANAAELLRTHNIARYSAISTLGTKETVDIANFGDSLKGGLKILFFDAQNKPVAYMWMRGSGTEKLFRVLCDAKGKENPLERSLLAIETELLEKADAEE